MRIVIDTNVFISAAFKKYSVPERVIRWIDHYGGLLKSEATEQELLQVLQRPRIAAFLPPSFLDDMSAFLGKAEQVAITKKIQFCRDPKDDKFLELAVNGHADILITGDKDLLTLGAFENIPIVKPSDFLYVFSR